MSRPVLRINSLSIGHDKRTLISDINLKIYPGEFISLIGPNGVGKSTLLKTIASIHPPISGTVYLCDEDVKRLNRSEIARRLGVVLTDRFESGSLKVGLLIELGRYAHSSWTGQLSAKDQLAVQVAVDATRVSHLLERELRDISDGERQRVMVARALAQQPRLLLLDEPTAFLDAPSRAELSGLLRRISSTENVAIITSTHDLDLAFRTTDKMWLMKQDCTVVVGDAEELLSNGEIERAFRNPFVKFDPITRSFRPR